MVVCEFFDDEREVAAHLPAVSTTDRAHVHVERRQRQDTVYQALRREWPRQSPLELARIARDLNAGKRLKFQQRLPPEVLVEWAKGERI